VFGYAVRRLLLIIPTLILVTIIVFCFIRFIPGDVVQVVFGIIKGDRFRCCCQGKVSGLLISDFVSGIILMDSCLSR
jgi:ABC-type microcin C transport system permease subunit YejB